MEKNKIFTNEELGKKVAKLAANREITEAAVKAKMKSLKELGLLSPATIVDAELALAQNLTAIDFETNEKVTKETAKDYVVLVDGNHRYQAWLNLKKKQEKQKKQKNVFDKPFYFIYSLNEGAKVAEILAEMNIASKPYKGRDYVTTACLANNELRLLQEINGLVNGKGFALPTAAKWLTFTDSIKPSTLNKVIKGKELDVVNNTTGIERGKNLIEAASIFSQGFLGKKYLVNWVITKYNETKDVEKPKFEEDMCNFLKSINEETAHVIENLKATEEGDKETLINNKLNEIWKNKDKKEEKPKAKKAEK